MHHSDHRWRGQTGHLLEAARLNAAPSSAVCVCVSLYWPNEQFQLEDVMVFKLLRTHLCIESKRPIADLSLLCSLMYHEILFEISIMFLQSCQFYWEKRSA